MTLQVGLLLIALMLLLWLLFSTTQRLKGITQKSEERYKTLTDNLAAAVILHNSKGVVEWCSPYTEVLTGYSISEIYAAREVFFSAHVHEDDRELVRNALAIVSHGEPFQCRYRFYHKSGVCLWLETRTVPVLSGQSQGGVALSITLDVTAAVNTQLKIEERNRNLNEFTYMVSHDLKTPIVTLRGMLEIVKEESQKNGATESIEPLEQMSKAIKRLENLVAGVLELARVSTTEREMVPVSISEVVAEVLDDHSWQIDRIGAKVVVAERLPWVFGNKTQLYQIFSNLLGNAIKYHSPSRALEVSIRVTEKTSRRRAIIEVRDNGRGIAPEFIGSIFIPFARAGETVIEGSGVGLAAVKRIMDKLGGSIAVDSVVGEGSAFTLDLRRASEAELK